MSKDFPMVFIRPSIIGASLEEPVPGWTDSIGLAGGLYLIAGLGILRGIARLSETTLEIRYLWT